MIQTQQASYYHHHAGPSRSTHTLTSSAGTFANIPPTLTSPFRAPTHVQAIHDFDPSLLASTSTASSNPNMYLNFRAGEIIRVHVRDGTGWWDGEISTPVEKEMREGPRRGWFPSNYVREMGWDGSLHRRSESAAKSVSTTHSAPANHSRQTSAASHHSRTSTTRDGFGSSAFASADDQGLAKCNVGGTLSPRGASNLPPALQTLLHPVVQSLCLLESAIHTNRKPHIQPSAACVISSIRSALLQTDCLSKESTILVSFPILAKERKVVLVELSKLVGCARSASGALDVNGTGPVDDAREMGLLAKAARAVFASVKRFLHLANECGVKPALLEAGPEVGESEGKQTMASRHQATLSLNATTEDRLDTSEKTHGHARMQEAFRLRGASIGDLRAARRRASSPPPPMPTASGRISNCTGRARSPSTASTPMSATFASSSGSGRSSPISLKSLRDWRMQDSIDSGSHHSHAASSDLGHAWEPTPPANPSAAITRPLGSIPDVHEAIGLAEDTLLSIIAAFIGHIHSHHIESHPSSHAHLIEMTRETIDAVRELLTIVEAVGRHAGVRLSRPREIGHLRVAKDSLYDVSSRLVEGTEGVANAPFSELGEESYDGEKARLLQTATRTLRAGTECVRLVKLCLPDEDMPQNNSTPRQGHGQARHSTPRPSHDDAVVLRDRVVGVRGVHTLSSLDRKATSLSTLQKRYQQDGSLAHDRDEDEEKEDQDNEEFVRDVSRDEDVTMGPIALAATMPITTMASLTAEGILRTHSDQNAGSRSRSSSLSSPAPPPRFRHRSPSRSADLDKFTNDYDLPVRPTRQTSPAATSSASRSSTYTNASTAETSIRSSGTSDHQAPPPHTPHAGSPILLDYLQPDVAQPDALLKLARLSIEKESEATPVKHHGVRRPSGPVRAATTPIPSANTDIRFWVVAHDYDPREITFNSDGVMIGASLVVLVEKMTPHDGPVDTTFSAAFFFTFRLFTTSAKLLELVIARYSMRPPVTLAFDERERAVWVERKLVPVRLRVYNLLKSWLDSHWKPETDDDVLDTLRAFALDMVSSTLPAMAPRLVDAIRKRQVGTSSASSGSRSIKRWSSLEDLRDANQAGVLHLPNVVPGALPPTPVISKSLNSLLHKNAVTVSITEFDTLELARQLTVMESKLFCAVVPEDLLQTGKKTISTLKALSTLSNQITGWVADNILNEQDAKKRAALLKFYIKLADKCLTLNNFSTLFAVLAGLNSSIVLRLKKTWEVLSSKYKVMMERLRSIIEHTKNHAAYRARLREVSGPCLPFLGLVLTEYAFKPAPNGSLTVCSITFTSEGNPDTRPSVLAPDLSLINQDKYAKLGRIAMDFCRYQEPFNFHELEPVQNFLRRVLAERGSGSLDALYRKSLLLEPRQGTEKLSSAVEKPGWLGGKV